jgi:DNA polymerase delta subunit 3
MLYDFHKWQNEKRDGSVHATYLVYGTKKEIVTTAAPNQAGADEDVEMTSSMPDSESVAETVTTLTLSLVHQELLEGIHQASSSVMHDMLTCILETLACYEKVTSVHVYSVGPHPMKVSA